jgi:broad specificity phosphatase PhoE
MTKETFIAILQEEGLTRFEAEAMLKADQRLQERGHGVVDVETLREFAREALPNFLRLRALQNARGARPDPDP